MDPQIGGLRVEEWHEVWDLCHCATFGGLMRLEWPEVGSLADQPWCVVEMFSVVESEVMKQMERSKKDVR